MSSRYADQEKYLTLKVKTYRRQTPRMINIQLLSWTVPDLKNLQMYPREKRHPTAPWINSLRSNCTLMKILILKPSRFSSLPILSNKLLNRMSRKCFRIFLIRKSLISLLSLMMSKVWKRISLRIKVLFLRKERSGRSRTRLYL